MSSRAVEAAVFAALLCVTRPVTAEPVHADDRRPPAYPMLLWDVALGYESAMHRLGSMQGAPAGLRFGGGVTSVPDKSTTLGLNFRVVNISDGSVGYFRQAGTGIAGELSFFEFTVEGRVTVGEYGLGLGALLGDSSLPTRKGSLEPQAFETDGAFLTLSRTLPLSAMVGLTLEGLLGYGSSTLGEISEFNTDLENASTRGMLVAGWAASCLLDLAVPLRVGAHFRYYGHGKRAVRDRSGQRVAVDADEAVMSLFVEVAYRHVVPDFVLRGWKE